MVLNDGSSVRSLSVRLMCLQRDCRSHRFFGSDRRFGNLVDAEGEMQQSWGSLHVGLWDLRGGCPWNSFHGFERGKKLDGSVCYLSMLIYH